jgi:3-hydroxyisobutyrate dehydrogenase
MALSASRILTMLPSTPQVESVYLDPKAGVLAGVEDLGSAESLPAPVNSKSTLGGLVDSITGTGNEHDPHTILIDQTTLDPTFAMSLAEKVQSETLGRALMLDAPVSGGELLVLNDPTKLTYDRDHGCCKW